MFRLVKHASLILFAALFTLPPAAGAQIETAVAQVTGSLSAPLVTPVERRELAPGIAEYRFRVRVGTGEHDVIGLHRVVRESAPFAPARTEDAVLLAHGDVWDFDGAFLAGDRPFPVYLAENGVDVWGIDFRWALVPAETADLTFMKDWGIDTDAKDLGVALAIARGTRAATGDGFGRIHLLGWSRGGMIGYAYLNAESQLPAPLRQVAGFLPVDVYLKTDVEEFRLAACRRLAGREAQLAGGTWADSTGQIVNLLGFLAAVDPAGASPIFPWLSNRQAGLLAGSATFVFFAPDQQFVPVYHFTGGSFETFDPLPVPAGLLYSPEQGWLDFLLGATPYQPVKQLRDAEALQCGEVDVPFDDHLSQVTVPVLYVGAGGGFGEYGVYSTTLLGSTDVTSHVVNLTPPEARLFDYGHADLWLGTDAPALVWQPILDWLRAH